MSIDTSTDSVRWLTYPEAAKALGVAPASVAKRATRRRWPRQLGNDGRARIGVPLAALPEPAVSLDSPPDIPPDSPGDSPPGSGLDSPWDRDALNQAVGRLEAENSALRTAWAELREERDRQLADLRTEREAERQTLRETVTALKVALESERSLRDELRRELDLARRPWWRRLAG
jgi:hypothetical protein